MGAILDTRYRRTQAEFGAMAALRPDDADIHHFKAVIGRHDRAAGAAR